MFNFLNPKLDFFGLDFSGTALKLAKVELVDDKPTLVSFGKRRVDPAICKNGKIKKEKEMADVIRELLTSVIGKDIKTENVIISLPEEKTFSQIIDLPRTKRGQLKEIIEYEAESHIPLPIEEVYIDFKIISENKDKKTTKILITAAPRKIVDPQVSVLERAGLFPIAAESEALAMTRAFVSPENIEPLIILDIGETKTNLIVFSDGIIVFSSYILVSSRDLTTKLAEDKKISIKEAEKIKVEKGLEDNKIHEVVHPLLEEMTETVRKHLDYYDSYGFMERLGEKKKIEKIILCGGGGNLKGLIGFLSESLNLPVEKGSPLINLSEKSKELFDGDGLSYGTSFGLALRNLEKEI